MRHTALARRCLALVRSGALRARCDAAVTTADNRRHRANAGALSADAGTARPGGRAPAGPAPDATPQRGSGSCFARAR